MRKNVLTIAAIIISCVSVFSQSVTETRRIKTTALQIYENYKVLMSGLYSKSAYTADNFLTLFDNKAVIYNDIVPDNTPQQLSPSDYFEKFQANIMRIYPVFSDFKMGEPVSIGDKWQIRCYFTRDTKFRTQKDMRYPAWSFNYIITIEMDKLYMRTNKVYENAKIVNVNVDNPLKGYFIIENRENIPLVTKSGQKLNEWDEEYQSRIFPEEKWAINDISVPKSLIDDNIFVLSKSKFFRNKTDAHFYQLDMLRYKKDIFGIGVSYNPVALGHKISEEYAEILKDIEHKSEALSLSFFYGKQIAHKGQSTVFFNFGVDFNRSSHEYNNTNAIHQKFDTIDVHGDPYTRKIKIDSLSEKINIFSVSVPLSVQYLHQLTRQAQKPVFLSLELGMFTEFTLSSSNAYNINASYTGVYEQYFGVEFDHYLDYGSGRFTDKDSKLAKPFDAGLFGGVGLWFALNESNLLKFNVSYKQSFNSPLKYEDKYLISKYMDTYQSLLHSTKQGMQNIGIGVSWVKTIGGK